MRSPACPPQNSSRQTPFESGLGGRPMLAVSIGMERDHGSNLPGRRFSPTFDNLDRTGIQRCGSPFAWNSRATSDHSGSCLENRLQNDVAFLTTRLCIREMELKRGCRLAAFSKPAE